MLNVDVFAVVVTSSRSCAVLVQEILCNSLTCSLLSLVFITDIFYEYTTPAWKMPLF